MFIEYTCYNEKIASNTLVVHKTVIYVITLLKNTRLKDNPTLTEGMFSLFILYELFVRVLENILLGETHRRHRMTCFYHRLLFRIVFLRSYRRCFRSDHSATAIVRPLRTLLTHSNVRVKIASHHLWSCHTRSSPSRGYATELN